jgi:hypothetical protein
MLNDYEEREQILITLYQILFRNSGNHQIQIKNLTDLLEENILLVILQEIEPEILSIANMEDFTLIKTDVYKNAIEASKKTIPSGRRRSVKFASVTEKYSNFVEILQLLKRYFENSQTAHMLRKEFNINTLIKVTDLLKPMVPIQKTGLNDSSVASVSNYNMDLLKLGEILLVLSALSTRRDDFINIINSLDESEMKYLYEYMNVIETYINFGSEKEEVQALPSRSPSWASTRVFRKGITIRQSVIQKEQMNFCKNIEFMEKEISQMKNKNEELSNELMDLGLKYRDIMRENELLKKNANQHNQIEEDAYFDSVLITQLKNDLMKKDQEIEDMRRDDELMSKRQNSELTRLNGIIENLEQKNEELKSVKFDNEKLKLKIKEMNINKDKLVAYDNLENSLEAKNKQIENLIKEKQLLISQTEKLIKENFEIREQLKEVIFQKKKIEFDLADMKKEITHINKRVTRRQTLKNIYKDISLDGAGASEWNKIQSQFQELFNKNITEKNKEITSLIKNDAGNLDEIMEETKEECLNLNLALGLEEELDNLRLELQIANKDTKKQLEENKRLNEVISELKTDKENLKIEIKQLQSEIDKLIIEKEKLEIGKQKFDLDLQRHLLQQEKLETDKNKLVDTINELRDKVELKEGEKDNLLNEIESLKLSIKMKTRQFDKLVEENKHLLNELENVPKGMNFNKYSSSNDEDEGNEIYFNGEQKEADNKKTGSVNFNIMNKMRFEINSKNDQIKQLNEKVRNLEKIEEIFKGKDQKIESDYKFYKKSYEEQKEIVNQEHEVLSNKLCDLAMQFVNFKNELLKNVKPAILNQQSMFNTNR